MIGLFFGSTNGNTAAAAEQIKQEFSAQIGISVEVFDIADYYLEELIDFDYLILGIPTWDIGQLQRDWEAIVEEFDDLDLTGKRAAIFGLGDQVGYPDTFGDAVFFLADKLESRGAKLIGSWPTATYTFSNSWAMREGRFLGLMLDEDNQPELSQERIRTWVKQLAYEFGFTDNQENTTQAV